MARTRINFGISEFLRSWILSQPAVLRVVEASENHFTFEHNMTSPQLNTFKNGFLQMLSEDLV